MILPDIPELVALRGAAQGLSLHARRSALARLHGGHRSVQRGRGLEFEEVRQYAPGDDARTIDWRVSARRGRLHTKLFREERERPVWLIVDLHPGLFFGSKYQYKSVLLLRAAALLGWVAILGGDRLGAVISNGQIEPLLLPPRAREAGILPVLAALVETQPRAPAIFDTAGLGKALMALRAVLQPGSLVLVLSDFSNLDSPVESAISEGALHNDFRLLWVTDPLERDGLPGGMFRVGLLDRVWWLDGQMSKSRWLATWAKRAKRIEGLADRLKVPLIRLDTPEPVNQTLPAILREPRWAA